MQNYKERLGEYLDRKLDNLLVQLDEVGGNEGLSTVEINSLIRTSAVYGQKCQYTVEELGILFEYYQKYIIEINRRIKFPPSKKNFCAFCGISTNQYNSWQTSADENRAEMMNIIDDYISDINLTSAQNKEVDPIVTMFRSKAEHGMVEASAPTMIVHKTELDMGKLKQQIATMQKGESLRSIELKKPDYEIE